jgi:hypothetical protein
LNIDFVFVVKLCAAVYDTGRMGCDGIISPLRNGMNDDMLSTRDIGTMMDITG